MAERKQIAAQNMDSNTIHLKINMLGNFTLCNGDFTITDNDNRSRKIWLLLAYMIYGRNHFISAAEFSSLLWSEEEDSAMPSNALKTSFHRLRTMLDKLGPNVGRRLILRKEGSYCWNTSIPVELDIDHFEALINEGSASEDSTTRLQCYREALALYSGEFLSKLESELWVAPIAAYFHNLYLRVLQETLELLKARSLNAEIVELCNQAIVFEPYGETIYQNLMRALIDLGEPRQAVLVYEKMSQTLFDALAVLPSEESRAVYHEACRFTNDHTVTLQTLLEQLREPDEQSGALFCSYDFFKIIYRAMARAIVRNGDTVHICLISALAENDEELPKRSLDRVIINLQDLIRENLRKGDIASRCSVSQFVLMLPQANYENSCMVTSRIVKAFNRKYPHSPAVLRFSVQPLEPNV